MKYHLIYRTHNLVNGKEYTGKHSTDNLDDGYYGSSKILDKAVTKYGMENFAIEILSFHANEESAWNEEAKIVDEEYVDRDDTYNQRLGGLGGWDYVNKNNLKNIQGMVVAKDSNSNIFHIPIDDERLKTGELVGIMKNKITVKDKYGNTCSVSVNDPRYLSGELVHHTKGTVTVKDKDGNTFSVSKNDPRYLSGELVGITKGHTFKIKSFEQIKCPHCKKIGRKSSMIRWHFDNCKLKI